MSDPSRTDSSRVLDARWDRDRDGKIEQLLLDGLDHYFAARYEHAINIWTRALFFDRSHPRARAYIERARSAVAERQREAEELLHRGVDAFHSGERDEARRLLSSAIDGGAPADEAHVLLHRMSRDPNAGAPAGDVVRHQLRWPARRSSTHARGFERSGAVGPGDRRTRVAIVMAVVVALTAAGAYSAAVRRGLDGRSLVPWPDAPAVAGTAPAARDATPPLPRRGEMVLVRSRALVASGRLHDALRLLDLVRPTDPQKAEADRLRADLQRQLLALAASPSPAVPVDADGRHP